MINYVHILEQQDPPRFNPQAHNRAQVQQEFTQLIEQYLHSVTRVKQLAESIIHTTQESQDQPQQIAQLRELMNLTISHPLLRDEDSHSVDA